VFEIKVLRKIFGTNKDEVSEHCNMFYKEEFCVYWSSNIVRIV